MDQRRMNVSLTRARFGLVIVGNRTTLARESVDWAALCKYCKDNRAMIQENGETVRANRQASSNRPAPSSHQ
jgi:hypothetical protein